MCPVKGILRMALVQTVTSRTYSLVLNRRHSELVKNMPHLNFSKTMIFQQILMKIRVICPVVLTKPMNRISVVLSNN